MIRGSINEALDNGEYIGKVVDLNEVLELIRGKYGDLDDETGAYCNREWMSVKEFAKILVLNAYESEV